MEGLELSIANESFDRVHGIGKVKNSDDGNVSFQTVMLKLSSWKQRQSIYRARKNLKNRKRIGLDLAISREKLLSVPVERVQQYGNVKDAFTDINCRLGLRMSDERRK